MFAVKFKTPIFEGDDRVFVAGFSSMSGVQRGNLEYAKQFKTEAAGEKFVQKYSGAGYGLTADMVEVVSV